MAMKRINVALSLLLTVALLFGMTSCSNEKRVEYCELGIVLTKDFITYESEGAFNVAYSDGKE